MSNEVVDRVYVGDEVHYQVMWGLLKINHEILGSRN